MDFDVKIFINGEEVASADLHKYVISNKVIDRLVNDVKDRGIIKKEPVPLAS